MLEYGLALEREIHVAGGRFMFDGGRGSCWREGGTAKESLQILDLVVGISGYVISNHV